MLYGIISDVHGNLEAATVVIEFLHKKGVEKVLVLGDVVGYGVNPEECIEIFESIGSIFIQGNHEEAVITKKYEIFTTDARIAIEWTGKKLSKSYIEKISSWKTVLEIEDFVVCHGGLIDPLHFYTNSRLKAKRMFDEFEFDCCFVGHTHFPMAFCLDKEKDKPSIIAQQPDGSINIQVEKTARYIINTGSVGQPRDGNPNACCGIYDTEKKIYQLYRLPYDVEKTAKKICDAGLPSSLASRILRGL